MWSACCGYRRRRMPKRKPTPERQIFVSCGVCNSSGYIPGYADMGKSFPLPTLTKCACLVRFEAEHGAKP